MPPKYTKNQSLPFFFTQRLMSSMVHCSPWIPSHGSESISLTSAFHCWRRAGRTSRSMPDRNQQKERNKRISSNKAIHPHTGRHRFLLTISLYWGPPWSDIRLTAKYGMSHLIHFIALMHRFHCTFCAHFFHNSEFQQIIVVICSFSLLLFLELRCTI